MTSVQDGQAAAKDVRTALLDAAEAEIIETGAAAASLRSIARRAGVSHQAPAHFFTNRRGLLTAVAARSAERLQDVFCEAADASTVDDPLEHLADIGMLYVEFAHANPGLFTLVSNSDHVDMTDPALVAARDASWVVLNDAVRHAQQTGWRADQETERIALVCWAIVHGSAALWSEGWFSAYGSDDDVRAMIRDMLVDSR